MPKSGGVNEPTIDSNTTSQDKAANIETDKSNGDRATPLEKIPVVAPIKVKDADEYPDYSFIPENEYIFKTFYDEDTGNTYIGTIDRSSDDHIVYGYVVDKQGNKVRGSDPILPDGKPNFLGDGRIVVFNYGDTYTIQTQTLYDGSKIENQPLWYEYSHDGERLSSDQVRAGQNTITGTIPTKRSATVNYIDSDTGEIIKSFTDSGLAGQIFTFGGAPDEFDANNTTYYFDEKTTGFTNDGEHLSEISAYDKVGTTYIRHFPGTVDSRNVTVQSEDEVVAEYTLIDEKGTIRIRLGRTDSSGAIRWYQTSDGKITEVLVKPGEDKTVTVQSSYKVGTDTWTRTDTFNFPSPYVIGASPVNYYYKRASQARIHYIDVTSSDKQSDYTPYDGIELNGVNKDANGLVLPNVIQLFEGKSGTVFENEDYQNTIKQIQDLYTNNTYRVVDRDAGALGAEFQDGTQDYFVYVKRPTDLIVHFRDVSEVAPKDGGYVKTDGTEMPDLTISKNDYKGVVYNNTISAPEGYVVVQQDPGAAKGTFTGTPEKAEECYVYMKKSEVEQPGQVTIHYIDVTDSLVKFDEKTNDPMNLTPTIGPELGTPDTLEGKLGETYDYDLKPYDQMGYQILQEDSDVRHGVYTEGNDLYVYLYKPLLLGVYYVDVSNSPKTSGFTKEDGIVFNRETYPPDLTMEGAFPRGLHYINPDASRGTFSVPIPGYEIVEYDAGAVEGYTGATRTEYSVEVDPTWKPYEERAFYVYMKKPIDVKVHYVDVSESEKTSDYTPSDGAELNDLAKDYKGFTNGTDQYDNAELRYVLNDHDGNLISLPNKSSSNPSDTITYEIVQHDDQALGGNFREIAEAIPDENSRNFYVYLKLKQKSGVTIVYRDVSEIDEATLKDKLSSRAADQDVGNPISTLADQNKVGVSGTDYVNTLRNFSELNYERVYAPDADNDPTTSGTFGNDSKTYYVYLKLNNVEPEVKLGSVDVSYVDENGQPIKVDGIAVENPSKLAEYTDVPEGTNYQVSPKEFDGYKYVGLQTDSAATMGKTVEGDLHIIFVYSEVKKGSVTVEHKLTDGSVLKAETNVVDEVPVGTKYETDKLTDTNYRFIGMSENSAAADGEVIEGVQHVVYLYEPIPVPDTKKGSVVITFVDQHGNVLPNTIEKAPLANATNVDVGTSYAVNAEDHKFDGYTFDHFEKSSAPNIGEVKEGIQEVVLVYFKNPDPEPAKGTVTVKHVIRDETGKETIYHEEAPITDKVGTPYSSREMEIPGYTLIETPSNATGKISESPIEVVYIYQKTQDPKPVEGTVTVVYETKDHTKLTPDVSITGEVGKTYTTDPKEFDGYTLIKTPENSTGTFTEENVTVIYVYEKTPTEGTVTVIYETEDHTRLTPDETVTGEVGKTYTTKPKEFDGYTLVKTPENSTGTFTKENIVVVYVYDKTPEKGTVTVIYETEDHTRLTPDVSITDEVGKTYTTENKSFDGYELVKVPTNSTGNITDGNIIVTYVYKKKVVPTPVDPGNPITPQPTETPSPTPEVPVVNENPEPEQPKPLTDPKPPKKYVKTTTSQETSSLRTTSVKTSSTNTRQNSRRTELPQTGEKRSALATAVGAILLAGATTLLGPKRKRKS